jgi:hypothetical protein
MGRDIGTKTGTVIGQNGSSTSKILLAVSKDGGKIISAYPY